ncbi:MAG: FAD-dependent oxidoreductase [Desulfobacteraceae bacterium]|nr:FAD-dependent oxidoreductase [Desulfobacteraceae bacterium]
MKAVDAAVIGGGPAGIAAAAAASRAGLKTVLLEKEPFVGGIPVKGYMTTLCGLYRIPPGSNRSEMLYDGVVRDFIRDLMDFDSVQHPVRMGKSDVLLFRPESFAAAASRLLENEPCLEVLCPVRFCEAEVSGNRIKSIAYILNARRCWIRTGAVIDASGDAEVCRAVDACLLFADETRQVPAIVFPLFNVAAEQISGVVCARWHMMIQRAVEEEVLPPHAASVSFLPAPDPNTLQVKLNLGLLIKNNPEISKDRLAQKGNEVKERLIRFFKHNIRDFKNCTTLSGASPVLHREGIRGQGVYVLARQDVLSAQKFSDAAARGCWPVEQWEENGNFSVHYPPEGQYYEIPKRCLKSSALENLFMAGKSISADSGAIASARVIGCCLATGQAAAKLAVDVV